MQRVFPDYYSEFVCSKSECKHNCCIGWEIDIDDKTAKYYKTVPGEFGRNLQQGIVTDKSTHFLLDENERCPFLNDKNLCEIIINLGYDKLCTVCDLHPRFNNELPGRIESGLGMCCESAARLILSKKDPVSLIINGKKQNEDKIIDIRDEIISVLQDRTKPITERIHSIVDIPSDFYEKFIALFYELERLDEKWTDYLALLTLSSNQIEFDKHMRERQHEYEQFLVYLTYRHIANAPDINNLRLRLLFIALSYQVIYKMGSVFYSKNKFDFEDQVELMRIFSSEIEYSENNIYTILNALQGVYENE